jgi:hypothetical protein
MLVHKSVDVRPEVWRKLRIHAELSDVSVRDYLSYLIEGSEPVTPQDAGRWSGLQDAAKANRAAAGGPHEEEIAI